MKRLNTFAKMMMRQGGCTVCRIGIIQPPSTQGAATHARYYGCFRLFKPVS
jgi:hypothetical protein